MRFIFLCSILFLFGCASTTTPPLTSTDTMQIIAAAADAAPGGVEGEFEFYVQASGKELQTVYLNTELDYRDQRNVSVSITPSAARKFEQSFGSPPEKFFVNKTIRVTGEAKRVRIVFMSNGRPSNSYYYQTHVEVSRPEQIEILN